MVFSQTRLSRNFHSDASWQSIDLHILCWKQTALFIMACRNDITILHSYYRYLEAVTPVLASILISLCYILISGIWKPWLQFWQVFIRLQSLTDSTSSAHPKWRSRTNSRLHIRSTTILFQRLILAARRKANRRNNDGSARNIWTGSRYRKWRNPKTKWMWTRRNAKCHACKWFCLCQR